MARIRTVKPEFWSNEQIMSCKPLTRLLFIGMWNFADDYGRMAFSPMSIKARVFPNDDFSMPDIKDMLHELCSQDLILVYSANGKEYIEVTGWDNQKIDKRQISKIPGPFEDGSHVMGTAPPTPADSRRLSPTPADSRRLSPTPADGMEGKGMDSRGKDSEANASDASVDHRKRLFSEGLSKIAAMTGKGPDSCRSFLGKCLKEAGDDAVVVLAAIEDAERNQVIDPSAYIAKLLKGRSNGTSKIIQAADDLRRKIASFDGPPSGDGPIRGGSGPPPIRLLSNG